MTAPAIELGLSHALWSEVVKCLSCEAAGHGDDGLRHDHGPAKWYIRNLHACYGPVELFAVCQRMGDWISANRELLGKCRVCGETRYLEDWAYVARKIG